jgi:hypothetical protein
MSVESAFAFNDVQLGAPAIELDFMSHSAKRGAFLRRFGSSP